MIQLDEKFLIEKSCIKCDQPLKIEKKRIIIHYKKERSPNIAYYKT